MAFIKSGSNVVSFAEFQDVVDRDSRLLDLNEVLNDENEVEPFLIRATERILSKIKATDWWSAHGKTNDVNANYIIANENDFTDLCFYTAMSEYLLPKVADFGTEDNNEVRKMNHYKQKAEELFNELIKAGSWYDFNADGIIAEDEIQPSFINRKRVR